MGNLTQTTAQVQTDLDAVEASNAGLASISDLSDTTATAAKKSGFHSLQASSSNAPSTDRAVLISAVRDTAASGEIRYGQVAITESNGLWWNSDDNGTLGTWSQAATVNTAQTISGAKTITGNMVFNSATLDVNGNELILDADGDTSITSDTDDQIDVKIAGADDFQFTANTFTALSGSTIKANTIAETTSASGVTIDGVLLKDSTSKTGTLTVGSGSITDSSGTISLGSTGLTLASGVLRIDTTGDATASSTAHGFQIGPTSGANLVIDNNEIMARNNGAVSALSINADGGTVTFGGAVSVTGAVTATGSIIGALGRIDVPGDYWSAGDFYDVGGYGHLSSDGGFAVSLTSNGYRDTDGLWVSQSAASGSGGASSISLQPDGTIVFRSQTSKATEDAHVITAIGTWTPSTFTVATSDLVLSAGDLTLSSGALVVNSGTTDTAATFRSSDAAAYIKLEDDTTTTGSTSVALGAIGDDLLLRAGGANHLRLYSTGALIHSGGDLTVSVGDIIVTTPTTPASASATGTVGTIAWDSDYMYVCVATDTWKRVAIATW